MPYHGIMLGETTYSRYIPFPPQLSSPMSYNRKRFALLHVFCTICAFLLSAAAVYSQNPRVNFSRDIRPILSDKCFQCHGPDESKRQGGLRLDARESATQAAESGETAIVAGKVDDSELIKRVTTTDAAIKMPPSESNKSLSAPEIDLLRRWITEGANYESHWAFNPPKKADLPTAESITPTWSSNPIDRFLAQRLKQEGLQPNEPADKYTLIRRAALDLIGLPPTPSQVDRFLADDSPEAHDRMLDELFASPRYGERMALNWLDYARYADSNGFQSDGSRDIWGWRDWVINAYNQNMPFDQFTIEQLAGDMLPNATQDQVIATGFNRNHRLNGEGGRIVEEWFVETVIDRVETTGLTWLGLTLNCCRCHDHKYDPISQREFYQLFAFFNSVDESGVLAPSGKNGENTPPLLTMKSAAHGAEIARREKEIAALNEQWTQAKHQLPELAATWANDSAAQTASRSSIWEQVSPIQVESVGGATLTKQEDGSYLASGKNPSRDLYRVTLPMASHELTAVRLEVMPDPSLPQQSLGRGFNGNFVMTEFNAQWIGNNIKKHRPIQFVRAEADFSQADWPAANVLKNKGKPNPQEPRLGWAIEGNNPDRRLNRQIIFVTEKPVKVPKGASLLIEFGNESAFADHNIGRFRLSVTSSPATAVQVQEEGTPSNVKMALAKPQADRTDADRQAIEGYFVANVANPIRELESQLKAAQKSLQDYQEDLPTTMVMKEAKPRDAFVLMRGEYDRPSEKVSRGVPAVFPPLPDGTTADRLGLARWIASRNNPLTARVWINREWERFFGTGIVKTTENLGSQSEFPMHAELLDWLAVEFMEPTVLPKVNGLPPHAWDMKAIQKLILMSAAYQQSARVTAASLQRDPENRLLSRGPRFRLPGEIVRDCAMAASGTLVDTIGGPSVRPYMPAGVWDETSKYGNLRNYQHDKGDGLHRRSLYTIWKRTAAPPTMLLFDAPNRETCSVKRSRTNTPLQALSLLNEVTFVEAARKLSERMIKEGGSTAEQRLTFGFRLACTRPPTETELRVLLQGLDADMQRFAGDSSGALALVGFGEAPAQPDLSTTELAAYTLAANVILNLDEFVTRE
jgi:Protein of unknown function (DUF1553)/Protein of unknown function (DUF1549)/Planctomycete cytochrome C